ncbi:MAG: PAS domain S-box protein, partial [Moraxellaceae bacterium]
MPLTRDTRTSQAYYWQPKQYLFISILAPMVLFLALVCAVELTARQEQLREQNLSQEHLSDKANQIRAQLEYELNSTLHLTTGLVSYIQSKHGALVVQEIDPWLSNLKDRARYMRNIGIAPDNTITYIYPMAGNEAALGLHYPDNKEQWPAIQNVIYSKRPMLAGPIHLQQGGLGLIYRVPVFLNDDYWGLVSTVLNFDAIYQVIHDHAEELGIKFAIKDSDNGGKILFGDKDVIANVDINLTIPGRNWQIISSLNSSPSHSILSTVRIAGWSIALIISVLFNTFLRSLAQQNKTLYELHESKYRFSQAFDSAPQGIVLINHNGVLLDFNNSLCSTLGYKRTELNDQNFFKLAAPQQRERLTNIIEGIYPKPGTNHQYESALLHKSGQVIDVIISLAPTHASIYESDWIIQIIDISHRIAFEHLLQEEASYNQSILDAVVDGIMILDMNGNIRSVNPAVSHIFGYAQDEFVNQHINQFIKDPETGSIMRHIKYHTDSQNLNADINHNVIGVKNNDQKFPLELQLSCI